MAISPLRPLLRTLLHTFGLVLLAVASSPIPSAHAGAPVNVVLLGDEIVDLRQNPETATFQRVLDREMPGFPGAVVGWDVLAGSGVEPDAEFTKWVDANLELLREASKLRRGVWQNDLASKTEWATRLDFQKVWEKLNAFNSLGSFNDAALIARFSRGSARILTLRLGSGDASERATASIAKMIAGLPAGTSIFTKSTTAIRLGELIADSDTPYARGGAISKFIRESRARIVQSNVYSPTPALIGTIAKYRQTEEARLTRVLTEEEIQNISKFANWALTNRLRQSWCGMVRENPSTLFVLPAGNHVDEKNPSDFGNNDIYPSFPGACAKGNPNVLATTATDEAGKLEPWADYGRVFELAAPSFFTTNLRPGLEVLTSGTCPPNAAIAGMASAIFSENPELTPALVKQRILLEGTVNAALGGKVATSKYLSRKTLRRYDGFPGLLF